MQDGHADMFCANALFLGVFDLDDRFLESKTLIIRRAYIEWQDERILPHVVTVTGVSLCVLLAVRSSYLALT